MFIDVCLEHGLKCCCFSPGVIPDESKAMSLLAPANAVAGMMPGGGLLPTPNPLASVSFFKAYIIFVIFASLACVHSHK